jgi:hypothetical protein
VRILSKNRTTESSKVLVAFRRFVRDILPIAMARTGVKIEPPTVDVTLVPSVHWLELRDNVPGAWNFEDDWMNVKAVAVYLPLSFEDRLRVLIELQQTDHSHNYDQNLDYNAVIFLHKVDLVKGQEERTVIELYAAMASACFGLVVNAATGCYGVCPIRNPLNDTNAAAAVAALTLHMTPSEFARRYGPED